MEFIGISYAGRGIYVEKPASWDELLQTAGTRFNFSPAIVSSIRVLYSSDLSGSSPRWELDACAWPGVKGGSSIYFEVNENAQDNNRKEVLPDDKGDDRLVEVADQDFIIIHVACYFGTGTPEFNVRVRKTLRLEKLIMHVTKMWHISGCDCRVLLEGQRVNLLDTPLSLEMQDGDTLEFRREQKGRKPAIYLLSPTPLETITIAVSLRPEWDFTVIYPLTARTKHPHKSTSDVIWTVSVQTDGTLVQKCTGRKSSYLFWEACTTSPGTIPVSSAEDIDPAFNPANPLAFFTLCYTTVTLPFELFEPYLDSVLESLTLTPAMCTEFIVYNSGGYLHGLTALEC